MIVKMCAECHSLFSVRKRQENQKRCPRCIAASDDRIKSIPLQRGAILNDIAIVESLPAEWQEKAPKRPHDNPYWQIDFRGRDMQSGWSTAPPEGRIVINATYAVKPGDKVRVRIIRALHDTKDGNQEVREYMSLSQAPDDMYPAWKIEWLQEDGCPPRLGWERDADGEWRKSVIGDGMGHLVVSPLAPQASTDESEDAFSDYGDLSDEDLIGEIRVSPDSPYRGGGQ